MMIIFLNEKKKFLHWHDIQPITLMTIVLQLFVWDGHFTTYDIQVSWIS